MKKAPGVASWNEAYFHYYYAYFVIVLLICIYLVYKGKAKNSFEIVVVSFYLMTGNLNEILTIKIPGFSFFEIKPLRFLLIVFSILLIRKLLFSKEKTIHHSFWTMPLFKVALFLYALFVSLSQFYHMNVLGGLSKSVINSVEVINFIVIVYGVSLITTKKSIAIIGKAMIIAAIFTTVIGLIQVGIEPTFMRIGDHRIAFGELLRANGLFSAENYNAYFLITTIAWVLIIVEKKITKLLLVSFFTLGVLITFHRMSYLILSLILAFYILKIEKVAMGKLTILGLSGISLLLLIAIVFSQDILNSAFVKERMVDTVEGRKGYYTMVYKHIGEKPYFGFGGKNNEVYFNSMLKITNEQKRATGTTGGIHSSYFSSLFYYGFPAFICFTAFCWLSVFYFGKLINYDLFFAIPFIIAVIYAIGGITNSFLFPRYLALFYAIHIGLGMGYRHLKEIVPVNKPLFS